MEKQPILVALWNSSLLGLRLGNTGSLMRLGRQVILAVFGKSSRNWLLFLVGVIGNFWMMTGGESKWAHEGGSCAF